MGLTDSLPSFAFQNISGSGTLFTLDITADDKEEQPILIDLESLDKMSNFIVLLFINIVEFIIIDNNNN